MLLNSSDPLTQSLHLKGIHEWDDLTAFVQLLPYGRNANRLDVSLVVKEEKGTCSSKHALLKTVATLNGYAEVDLILGIYKMNRQNTPGIGSILEDHGLTYIPEAHCYVNVEGEKMDFTSTTAQFQQLSKDLIEEQSILPYQVDVYKVEYHQMFLQGWMHKEQIPFTFEQLWDIREQCIKALESRG